MRQVLIGAMAAILAASTIAGCTKEETGAVVGGVTGAAVGSAVQGKQRTAAIILGTVVGTMIGATVGRYMDEQDRLHTAQAFEYNRTGETSVWQNPDTQKTYRVTPTETYYQDEGTPCREFTMEAEIGGKMEEVYGTACRQADGSWKIVESR